jgi:hypothetical protein
MIRRRKAKAALLAVLIVYCLYAGLFIYRTSFVIDGERYFSLFDDAMISMRYARNLAEGNGLVWNAGGEKVEGYTNLLWTIWMAVLHHVPVPESKTSLLVQITSAVLLLVNIVIVRKIALLVSGGSDFVWLGAVLVSAFYLPLNGWSLQGMEVGMLALIVSASVLSIIHSLQSGTFSIWPYILLCLGMYVRPDMAVPFLVVLGFLCVSDREHRKHHLGYGLSLFVIGVAGPTVFRLLYYGELLPSTYYLKMTGYPFILRLTRGMYVTLVFIWRLNWVLFLLPAVFLFGRRQRSSSLLLAVFLGQVAYSIYVGGDAWEEWGGSNRYVTIAMPCFFVAFFSALERVGSAAKTYISTVVSGPAEAAVGRFGRHVRVGVLVMSLVSFNAIYGPIALTEMLLLKPTLHADKNQKMVERALLVASITDPEAKMAVVWDGAIPYFADRYTVSILGKNDKRIARIPMRTVRGPGKLVAFYPGHLKWDYAYSIGELKPDVVVHLWQAQEEAEPYLYPAYMQVTLKDVTLHLRKGSPHILWDRVWSLATEEQTG